ncbi:unnamed protein product [Paramecium pentaurelia]|uniref:Uncharacterized protein n=1 Tax=Paramecium pentaurelia TaxID=43138 RepID=A0A8S1TNU1_9CILI|nr:unnamed protein product [Paramecium pentaurelia]
MNQGKKHHFQDKNIEIVWTITQDLPQNNQKQITYELIQVQPNENIGYGDGQGQKVKLSNGQEFPSGQDQQGQYNIFVDNAWVPLEQKLAEFQQQIQQQKQTNNELLLYVEVKDYEKFNEYRGFITAKDYLSQTQDLGEELEDLSSEIDKHIQSIFDKNSSVYLKMTNENAELSIKLQLAKGKKLIEFMILIPLVLKEQNKEEKEKLIKDMELNTQKQRLEKLEQELKQLKQSQQQQNQFKKVTMNDINKVQKQEQELEKNIYISREKLSGQFEFELLIANDEIEFQVGIIADDDLGNIEIKKQSYYVILPDGKFARGKVEFGNFFTYKLQVDDKLGLRVDTVKKLFQLVINDYPFPPVKISESIEQFSFIIISSEELNIFAQVPQQQ